MISGQTAKQEPTAENIVAKCFLSDKEDEREITYITPFWLHIINKKKHWRFDNENIANIMVQNHKLMGPLIGGGLIACFAIILISANLFDPFILLTGFVGGLVLIYHGWTGSTAIIVNEKNDSTVIYLKEPPAALDSYLKFYRDYLQKRDKAMSIYHIASSKEWENSAEMYHHASLQTEKFIHASTKEQVMPTFEKHFPEQGEFTLLEIDIAKLNSEVKYELVQERNQPFPHIYGEINKSAVTRTFPFRILPELRNIMFKL